MFWVSALGFPAFWEPTTLPRLSFSQGSQGNMGLEEGPLEDWSWTVGNGRVTANYGYNILCWVLRFRAGYEAVEKQMETTMLCRIVGATTDPFLQPLLRADQQWDSITSLDLELAASREPSTSAGTFAPARPF